jgi:hypothetical protein
MVSYEESYEIAIKSFLPKGWEYETGYGSSGLLTCPHGYQIEQDGQCPEGCISPLVRFGFI